MDGDGPQVARSIPEPVGVSPRRRARAVAGNPSVRTRQPLHRKIDHVAGQLVTGFDLRQMYAKLAIVLGTPRRKTVPRANPRHRRP